nr:unnamed protein product [Spirometra erinaceieuropaei]
MCMYPTTIIKFVQASLLLTAKLHLHLNPFIWIISISILLSVQKTMSSGGTVQPSSYMNPQEDAETLEKAMKGLGTDEEAIINLLSKRSVHQRQQIAVAYKSIYGKDLKDRLYSELSGNFRRAVLYSFYDMAHVNAKACYKAMKGAGTDEQVLIDVICTSTNAEIRALKDAYGQILLEEKQNALRRNLELDVKNDTSGDFQRVLIALLQAQRGSDVDDVQIRADCEELYKGGEAKLGTDEATFTRILVSRSWKDIVKINDHYTQAVGHDLITAIGKETSGDYRKSLQTIVKTAINRTEAYAEILYQTMKGAGTHDDNLVRMIIAHSEVDLAVIRHTFDGKYEKSLDKMIEGDTSGDYRRYLLAILGN